MIQLGLNIDHVATLRQARYKQNPFSFNAEPSPLEAAKIAQNVGAHSITAHLREDRRHIQLEDMQLIRSAVKHLNMEMAPISEMVKIALEIKPDEVCLVPEKREEVTTEGGLDVVSHLPSIRKVVSELSQANIIVSLFIDPDPDQIKAAKQTGAHCIELHTGQYAMATDLEIIEKEIEKHKQCALLAHELHLQVNAGHGLNYKNVSPYIRSVPFLHTLNIGHAIISAAIFLGLENALKKMLSLIEQAV
ncbi:pyridoxine 5'-phosphate synthase [Candidatus Methylacidiphilum fumarolicum]|uniref:Pyridoxine 5'-phosphate synthase n=2 Tax=Candidatus Methylacidiphilum fumarolicum TaxID=591154 RepID=I0JX60_METFB|nr:pyridoxine 5'-phosphate synthase [Candidatus Methylacidiphilum fumarolicum]MBW6415695.1 pyridoxine 5'-phosphate synthase [Candidatus Methylacidiphilum fumarolicum]TFE67548.1 pyridoxine 5'-phosphate synthase [Candidatus Methylacidiphilum fumarolicum]TFE71609.1 pyridoxine 5'-phosphate synthase [Candidatus Methylacidiphilum fumarolicum]TFE73609.1 pyridoxine 5'-phosphate synthase [Candidatus Methylacidiphilum fumarolicum]TFE75327.1 pyridoxine 5'-phosphate synthase [Candidatus Methylacidiphilum 